MKLVSSNKFVLIPMDEAGYSFIYLQNVEFLKKTHSFVIS
jgi:hypothetical protein